MKYYNVIAFAMDQTVSITTISEEAYNNLPKTESVGTAKCHRYNNLSEAESMLKYFLTQGYKQEE